MEILFISPRQCWPVLSGAKLREYHLARALGSRASVTYVFFAEGGLPLPTRADLPFFKEIVPVDPPQRYSAGRIVRGIVGRWPLPVENYTSAEMTSAIHRIAGSHFDLVHLDGVHLAAYMAPLGKLAGTERIVFDWHNIESEGMRRYAAGARSPLKRAYAALTTRRLAALERMLLEAGFGHLVCSERERRELLAVAPAGARIAVVENGVDVSYFEPAAPETARTRILFVGAMSYHANIDAIVPFARHLWPQIRKERPAWRLTVAGAKPARAVLELRSEPGVEVTGTVDDVRPYYREAFAAIVPLRTGMGTRLKILEAMAAGVPVVSTTIGAEGLAVTPDKNILIADRDEDWAAALRALGDEVFRRSLVDAGRDLVRSRYDWPILGDTLYSTYRQWIRE